MDECKPLRAGCPLLTTCSTLSELSMEQAGRQSHHSISSTNQGLSSGLSTNHSRVYMRNNSIKTRIRTGPISSSNQGFSSGPSTNHSRVYMRSD